ncbi:MAG: hypothetical protein WBC44_21575, partial [Planctomycetaceae bacterium]
MRFSLASKPALLLVGVVLLIAGVAVGAALPWSGLRGRAAPTTAESPDEHAGHDHASHGEAAADMLEVSDQARRTIGLTVGPVTLGPYT